MVKLIRHHDYLMDAHEIYSYILYQVTMVDIQLLQIKQVTILRDVFFYVDQLHCHFILVSRDSSYVFHITSTNKLQRVVLHQHLSYVK